MKSGLICWGEYETQNTEAKYKKIKGEHLGNVARVYGWVLSFPGVGYIVIPGSDNNVDDDKHCENIGVDNDDVPGVGVRVESDHIVVAVYREVRLPVQCNLDDKDEHDTY